MERKSPKRIDRGLVMEAIKSMYGEEVFKQYMDKEVAYSILPKILGDVVYSYLSEIKMKDNTLTVKVSSSPLKSNLALQKSNIIKQINNKIGCEFVENIVFL